MKTAQSILALLVVIALVISALILIQKGIQGFSEGTTPNVTALKKGEEYEVLSADEATKEGLHIVRKKDGEFRLVRSEHALPKRFTVQVVSGNIKVLTLPED